MKAITTTIAATLFAVAASGVSAAEDVYQGLGAGHPDLSSHPVGIKDGFGVSALQPGVGSEIDRYQGIAQGNGDLFNVRLEGATQRSQSPTIYGAAQGNPDLSF